MKSKPDIFIEVHRILDHAPDPASRLGSMQRLVNYIDQLQKHEDIIVDEKGRIVARERRGGYHPRNLVRLPEHSGTETPGAGTGPEAGAGVA